MFRARARTVVMVGMLAVVATTAQIAAADPSRERAPVRTSVMPELDRAPAHSCSQPACRDLRPEGADRIDDKTFHPVDVRIHLGGVAVATMEGVWLRRGPRLRNVPIMVSPVVVGDAVVMALGGRF